MKWLIPSFVIMVGAGVAIGGLLYGAIAFGVPTQDASPKVAAREARVVQAASLLMTGGGSISTAGVAGLAGVAVVHIVRQRVRGRFKNRAEASDVG